jgi:hypothetical protein
MIALCSKTQHFLNMKQLFFRKQSTIQPAQKPLPPLHLCLLMDALGMATFALPFVGEVFDLFWAPVSGWVYFRMFGGTKGLFGGAFAFFEELMPGLDIIPTFTISWLMLYAKQKKNT